MSRRCSPGTRRPGACWKCSPVIQGCMRCGSTAGQTGSGVTGCGCWVDLRLILGGSRPEWRSIRAPRSAGGSLWITAWVWLSERRLRLGMMCSCIKGLSWAERAWRRRNDIPRLGTTWSIGAAAILLGPITVGEGARVGANSVVVKSVPPGATVVGVPGRIVEEKRGPVADLEHGRLPDPVSEAMRSMAEQQGMNGR